MKMQVININENGAIEVEVFSKRIAFELRKKGYKIVRTEPNKYKPQFDNFIFLDEGNFQEDFNKIKLIKQ